MNICGKNPQNYVPERSKTCVFEKKGVGIDIFNEEEQRIVKERVEKCKIKRKEVAEKNKDLRKRKSRAGQKKRKKNVGQVARTQQSF